MSSAAVDSGLVFPKSKPPEAGVLVKIAPGIQWLRLALPYALDHVNVYLVEDGRGWAIVDTGLGDERTRAVWERLLDGPLRTRPVTRLLVTHFHPDHVGLAGWLCDRLGVELSMSQTEYFLAQTLRGQPDAISSPAHVRFYRRHGLSEETVAALTGRGSAYLHRTTGLPASYRRLVAGEHVDIGGRRFDILTGGGHAPEQVMLLCREEGVFLAADQVLARISPNVSVWAWEPHADPLGAYLRSLEELHDAVPHGALVLAAHNLPFRGLHTRAADLMRHHERRCELLLETTGTPRTVAELVPVLFTRPLDAQQMSFAFAETLAHVNYLLRRQDLATEFDGEVQRVVRT